MKGKVFIGAVIVAALALVLMPTVVRADSGNWIGDISAAISFYKGANPGTNFEPYLGQMEVVRALYKEGDHHAVHVAMNGLMDMLDTRKGGIPAQAADELFNYCNLVTPAHLHDVSRHLGRTFFEPKAPETESCMTWDAYGEFWFNEQQ